MNKFLTVLAIVLISLLQVGIVWTMAFIYANHKPMFWVICVLFIIMQVLLYYDEIIDVK